MSHIAQCPEDNPLVCAQENIPPYVHDQRIAWFRSDLGVQLGLGTGWQVGAAVPFDVRMLRIRYETLDGEPYDNPYPNIHHRNETQWGAVDGRLTVQRFARAGKAVIGGGVGTTLPLGATEADPYRLTAQGLEHQHLQMGSGTFVPMLQLQAFGQGERWGGLGQADLKLPVYANAKGFRPPLAATLGGGPSLRLSPKVQAFGTAELLFAGPERWHGDAHGGSLAVVAGLGGVWRVADSWSLQGQARTTAWQAQAGHEGDEQLIQRLIVTVGASWMPRRHHDADEEPH